MTNLLAATTLNGSLAEIVANISTLMDSFWIYIVLALAAVVVVWGAYVGIKEFDCAFRLIKFYDTCFKVFGKFIFGYSDIF